MNALLELIYSTPGIEDPDEIVLELPRKLCLRFGDECYRVISDHLLAEQDITRSEKLKTVLEQLPRYTDGVSTTFLAWCGENFAALAEVPSNLHPSRRVLRSIFNVGSLRRTKTCRQTKL